jgi:predicted metal-dependent enzyme (double-stranded beta helix superfamily)
MEKILNDLKALAGKKIEPNLVREIILSHDLKNLPYQDYIKDADMSIYNRIPLMEEPVQAFIMIRPPQHNLPIHHHNNFWGFIVPLRGIVAETVYRYDEPKQKMYIHPTKTYSKGEYIYEPFNVLHKLQNTSPIEPAITFHVRYPSVYNYAGTMIIDAKNRRLAILSEKAQQVGWDLPDNHYQRVEENAYDLEKLW